MSNIAISEIQTTVSNFKKDDLLLVSTVNGNNIYQSAKTTYDKLIKPAVVSTTYQNQVKYYSGNASADFKVGAAHFDLNVNKVFKPGSTTVYHWWESTEIPIPNDYVTLDVWSYIEHETNTSVENQGYYILYLVNRNRGFWRKISHGTVSYVSTSLDVSYWHHVPPITIAKDDGNVLIFHSCNIKESTSYFELSMFY